MMSMDSPFGMPPQRRPPGVFGNPGGGSDIVGARPMGGFGGVGNRPVAPVRVANENGAPAQTTAPIAGPTNSGPFTPRPDVQASSGPYNYSGPSMKILGMTDSPMSSAMPPAALPGGAAAVNRFFGGFGGGDSFGGPGGGRRMFFQ